MPVINEQTQFKDDENKQNQQGQNGVQQVASGAAPQISSGESATGGTSAPAPAKPNSSGQFVNLQKYLQANKQADISGNIGKKVETQAGDVRKGIEQSQQQFGQQSEAGRNQYDQGLVSQALTDPTQFLNNAPQLQQLQYKAGIGGGDTGTYKGPTELINNAQLGLRTGQIGQEANAAKTEKGRFGLLKNLLGGDQYTGGQQRLDQMLLQKAPGSLDSLQQRTGTAAKNISDVYGKASGEATNLGQQYTQEAKDTIGRTMGQIQSARDEANQTVQQKAQQLANQKNNLQQEMINNLNKGVYTGDMSRILGGDLGNFGELYGVDPRQFLSATGPEATARNVATADQAARIAALAKIAGTQAVDWENAPGDMFNAEGFKFAAPQLQSAVEGAKNSYNQRSSNLVDEFKKNATFGSNIMDSEAKTPQEAQQVLEKEDSRLYNVMGSLSNGQDPLARAAWLEPQRGKININSEDGKLLQAYDRWQEVSRGRADLANKVSSLNSSYGIGKGLRRT